MIFFFYYEPFSWILVKFQLNMQNNIQDQFKVKQVYYIDCVLYIFRAVKIPNTKKKRQKIFNKNH